MEKNSSIICPENAANAPDKPDPPRRRRPVRTTVILLTAITLVFAAINLKGRLSLIFSDPAVSALLLSSELDAEAESGSTLPHALLLDELGGSLPAETSADSSEAPAETSLPTGSGASESVYPPAAANVRAPGAAVPSTVPNSADDVITTVIRGSSGSGYLEYGGVYIKNNTYYSPDISALQKKSPALGEDPAVLIIHTHSTECYLPTELDSYKTEAGDRCFDTDYNVVRVGDELAASLKKAGIRVIHDRTLFDAESYTGAYGKSYAAAKKWLENDPSIAIVLDLHRDALNAEGNVRYRLAVDNGGVSAAQILLIVGTDAGGAAHPGWMQNLCLGVHLQTELNALCPDIARPMLLTNSSYNQEISPGALLVEVGTNGNSLSEALESARVLGAALCKIIG